MSKNEMIPMSNYTALKDFNLADAITTELSGMDISFDRVNIPAAGGQAFEVPGEMPGEIDMVKEFTGVILFHHPLFTYWRERYAGGNSAPDCGSYDGVTGVGNPGGSCAAARSISSVLARMAARPARISAASSFSARVS